MKGRRGITAIALAAVAVAAALALGVSSQSAAGAKPDPAAATAGNCTLANGIKHVIHMQFDNVHLRRDNPNVPSDLEFMPNLKNFLQDNGTLMNKHYTILISHTAGGILSSLTGLYPDRHGPAGLELLPLLQTGRARPAPAAPSTTGRRRCSTRPAGRETDFTPEMINENGKIARRHGFRSRAPAVTSASSMANTVLENTAIDIPTVFGPGSDEAGRGRLESRAGFRETSSASASTAPRDRASAEPRRTRSPICSPTSRAGTPATGPSSGRSTSTR